MNENFFNNRRIASSFVTLLVLGSAFLAVKTISLIREYKYIGGAGDTLAISGMGEISAKPDTAEANFTVTESGKTAAEAQSKATPKSNAIIDYLKANGFADKDIKTQGYNVYPKYENQPITYGASANQTVSSGVAVPPYPPTRNVIVGYEASESITITTKNTDKIGEVLKKIGELGASNISGVNFTIADPEALQADARDKAIADAKQKAERLAKALGVSLVRIVSFNDNGSNMPYYAKDAMLMSAGSAAPAPELPTGENKISAQVTITYEIR